MPSQRSGVFSNRHLVTIVACAGDRFVTWIRRKYSAVEYSVAINSGVQIRLVCFV